MQRGDPAINERQLRDGGRLPKLPRLSTSRACAEHRFDFRERETTFLRLADKSNARDRAVVVSALSTDTRRCIEKPIAFVKAEGGRTQAKASGEFADGHKKRALHEPWFNRERVGMKTSTLISVLVLTLPLASATCAFGGDEKPAENPLPMSCTQLAMSPTERTAHLERLKLLQRASSAVATTSEGFNFKVNLQTMPFKELQTWAQAEQNCCSFLKIDSQAVEAEKVAVVHVVCAANAKKEVMETFGLQPEK